MADAKDNEVNHGLEPLLETATTPVMEMSEASATTSKKQNRHRDDWNWRNVGLLMGSFGVMLMVLHVLLVLLLRKTTLEIKQIVVPDLCHLHSNGEAVVTLNNPSYCAPHVGSFALEIRKSNITLMEVQIPAFQLHSGRSTVMSTVQFHIMTTPETLYDAIFSSQHAHDAFELHGKLPLRISCFLIPFTVHIDLQNLFHGPFNRKQWNFQVATTPIEIEQITSDASMINIKDELERLVNDILRTIGLSHIHVENDENKIFAFTDVTFDYSARVLWNLPTLMLEIASDAQETILLAGFERFVLGNGKTFISAFSELFKSQTTPLQRMIQSFLTGNDVHLIAKGNNQPTNCFSLQVLNLMNIGVTVPGKVDGHPLLLRHYAVQPTLKELDSIHHKCLLELRVQITVHNPLPVEFDLYAIQFDLSYADIKQPASMKHLLHIDDRAHVQWKAHDEQNVTFTSKIKTFDTCKNVITVYLQDQLAFAIDHGKIRLGAANGNVTIPFSVAEIRIHPSFASPPQESIIALS